MKKILSLILVFAGLFMLSVNGVKANNDFDFHEDLTKITDTGSSYKTGEFVGNNDINWSFLGRSDQTFDGKALLFGENNAAYLTSSDIDGGISSFSIDVKNLYGGNANRAFKLEILQEDKVVFTRTLTSTGEQAQTYTISDIEIIGVFRINIINTGGLRILIDNIRWKSNALKYPINIDVLLDSNNIISLPEQSVEYGSLLNLNAIYEDYNFAFWVVNGFVRRDLVSRENAFVVNGTLNIQQVFHKQGEHAVLFMDINGKLINVQYVLDGEAAVAPSVEGLSKPGYILNQENPWLDHKGLNTLENINYSRVYTLQYEKTNNDVFTISVDGVDAIYEYNELATITSEDPLFTHWESNGKVVSTNRTYTFTVVENKVFTAKTTEIEETTRVIMTNDLKVRENYQTFIAQIDLLDGETIVENGYILLEDGLQKNNPLTLDSKDIIKVQSNVLNKATNEFTYSFQEKYAVVRAYVVTKDAEGNLNTYYSENQYSNGVIVTLDIDGKIEKTFHLLGTIFTEPVQPTKNRMNFAGWFVGDEEFNFATELSEDITIKARFSEPTDEQKVQYAKEDLVLDTEDYRDINIVKEGSYSAVITWISSDITIIDNNGQLISRPADADVIITLTATITIGEFSQTKEFTVLVPKDVAQQWTVSFETNGGTELGDILVDDQGFINEPENIVKDGYKFGGWYLDLSYQIKYDFNTPVTNDIIIYAKWELDDVTYKLNLSKAKLSGSTYAAINIVEELGVWGGKGNVQNNRIGTNASNSVTFTANQGFYIYSVRVVVYSASTKNRSITVNSQTIVSNVTSSVHKDSGFVILTGQNNSITLKASDALQYESIEVVVRQIPQ